MKDMDMFSVVVILELFVEIKTRKCTEDRVNNIIEELQCKHGFILDKSCSSSITVTSEEFKGVITDNDITVSMIGYDVNKFRRIDCSEPVIFYELALLHLCGFTGITTSLSSQDIQNLAMNSSWVDKLFIIKSKDDIISIKSIIESVDTLVREENKYND